MRILVFSQHYWPESFRITAFASELRDAGANVSVLTAQPNYPDGKVADGYAALSFGVEVHDGLAIHRVPIVPRGKGTALNLVLNYLSFVAAATVFAPWLLRGQRFDVVLVYATSPILQAIPAIWISWLKSARLVTWVQDLWPESLAATGFVRNPRALSAVGSVVGWIYARNDLLLAQSRAFIPAVQERSGTTPVEYFPNPGERSFDSDAPDRLPVLELDAGFNIVFAGNLGTVQALETVVKAATLLVAESDIRFVLVGSGSRSEWVSREVQRLGLSNVYLPGRFEPEDIPGILRQASVVLVTLSKSPILARTVPSKVQSYLAAGRPILGALDGEGARIIHESGAGVAVPAEDAESLAAAACRLRDLGSEELASMGARGRVYYEREFAPQMLSERLLATLSGLVPRGK